MDAGLQQFAEKYNLSLQDPYIQEKYIHNRLAELDYQTNMNIYREEGMEIIVTRMLNKGIPAEEIAEQTDLPLSQIIGIKEHMK